MSLNPELFEMMGAFYLGREYDLKTKQLGSNPLLYDSKDLVTHGVVLGMTGSGKTGLCIGMLEEAAMDSIPAIVIDPKGDIPNLMLSFPEMNGSDFRPWINEEDARKKGLSPEAFANDQASRWKKGLGEWGQTGERIRQMRSKVEINVYTPGSNAGLPVSILSSLDAPPFEMLDDPELLGDRVENTVTSLLGMMGIEADPIQSREHILLSQIFLHAWRAEKDVSLPQLIQQVQSPPFEHIGVVPLESFMEEKKRFALAMQLNNLLASPGFQSWTQGTPLNVKRLLHNEAGKPRISIFSIAHLDDSERMFFVSMLLNQILSWMRGQTGTSSLRALVYMDEIYGYLPPVQNPPSKKPLLTMLKQARAYGVGLLLATQNPVDLDYKALSNIGSWFIGRLQTQRDKDRVMDGLQSVAATAGGGFDRSRIEAILSSLDSRVFLLNNVHEEGLVTFHVRWVMSYLRGPLSRRQIKTLMDPVKKQGGDSPNVAAIQKDSAARNKEDTVIIYQLSKSIDQVYLPLNTLPGNGKVMYRPAALGLVEIAFDNAKSGIRGNKSQTVVVPLSDSPMLNYQEATRFEIALKNFDSGGVEGATRASLPKFAQSSKFYTEQKKSLADWLYNHYALFIYHAVDLKAYSQLGESESDFRVRLQQSAKEIRDEKMDELRDTYAKKVEAKERQISTAERAVAREEAQAQNAKMSSLISIGSTLLSAFLGRKKLSATTLRSGATAARGVSRSRQQRQDVEVAEDRLLDLQTELEELEKELEQDLEELRKALDPLTLPLEKTRIKPYKKNIQVKRLALAWLPYLRVSEFEIRPAWGPNL